jgi:hypothetical protein
MTQLMKEFNCQLDSKQYREAERQKWDSVANGWKKWWNTTERGAGQLSKCLIELAELYREHCHLIKNRFEVSTFLCQVISILTVVS